MEVRGVVRSRLPILAALAAVATLTLSGCTNGPPASVVGQPVSSLAVPSFGPGFRISGSAKTGSSSAIALDGSYQVQWSATPDKPGCTFHLFVSDAADGPAIIDLGQSVLPGKAIATGTATVSVSSGRYFLQADRSASTDCKGGWTAMINPEVAGPS